MRKSSSLWLISATILCLFAGSLSGQTIWLNQGPNKALAIEILKPSLDGDDQTTIVTSAIFLNGRFPISGKLIFVGELPFAHFGRDIEGFDTDSESTIGNPYLGFEVRDPESNIYAEFGLRLPLASEDKSSANSLGLFTDFDRIDAFLPDVVGVSGRVNHFRKNPSNLVTRVRLGGSLVILTEDRGGDDMELFANYAGFVGFDNGKVQILGGLTGILLITEEDADFAERTVHQLGVQASLVSGSLQPGVHLRVPIDDELSDIVDFIFGINLGIELR